MKIIFLNDILKNRTSSWRFYFLEWMLCCLLCELGFDKFNFILEWIIWLEWETLGASTASEYCITLEYPFSFHSWNIRSIKYHLLSRVTISNNIRIGNWKWSKTIYSSLFMNSDFSPITSCWYKLNWYMGNLFFLPCLKCTWIEL